MTTDSTIRHQAGQVLVVGLSTPTLSPLERTWLRLIRPAGIILFKRNIEFPTQTRALLGEAAARCTPNSLRCVDIEGGTVNRLRDALAPLPSPRAVAQTKSQKNAKEHGDLIARAAQAFGFNTTLAPVLDLGLPQAEPILGTRTAGPTPADVIAYAQPFLAACAAQNIATCGKHFPGLGGATADTHLLTPSIPRKYSQLWCEDLLPYRNLHKQLPMVMINHAAYPATPGKKRPASVSPFWITTVLRNRLNYRGLIFSDDFEMGGILNHLSIEEAVIESIRAGMDLIEICHSPDLILAAWESLIAEAERSPAFARLLAHRARATSRKRAKLFSAPPARALTPTQLNNLRTRIEQFNSRIGEGYGLQPVH
jgi:beta-N-acetylhexosaminidase